MNLNYFEVLALGAKLSDFSEHENFLYEKYLPAGDTVDFVFHNVGEIFVYEMWINNELYIDEVYVRPNSPGRDQMLVDLKENTHETMMRYAQAEPGSEELRLLEELCQIDLFAKKFYPKVI